MEGKSKTKRRRRRRRRRRDTEWVDGLVGRDSWVTFIFMEGKRNRVRVWAVRFTFFLPLFCRSLSLRGIDPCVCMFVGRRRRNQPSRLVSRRWIYTPALTFLFYRTNINWEAERERERKQDKGEIWRSDGTSESKQTGRNDFLCAEPIDRVGDNSRSLSSHSRRGGGGGVQHQASCWFQSRVTNG